MLYDLKFRILHWWHGWENQTYRVGFDTQPFYLERRGIHFYLVYNSKRLLQISLPDLNDPTLTLREMLAYNIPRLAYQKFRLKLAPDLNSFPKVE